MIKLDLTINEVNAILLSLAKLPYETVSPLIEKIREQSLPQVPEEDRNDARRDKLQADLLRAVNDTDTLTPEAL
jgi:hypothetical protein